MSHNVPRQFTGREAIIVGGSIAGLMCGISLKHAGYNVVIIEQDNNERLSHMAGLSLGPSAVDFLLHHDRLQGSFAHTVGCVQSLKDDGAQRVLAAGRRDITSWDTLYYRLRSNFDGYASTYCPLAPQDAVTDGSAAYVSNMRVLDIGRSTATDSLLTLTMQDRRSHHVSTMAADLVIGADGPDSLIRAKYHPEVQRQYAGYIAWRGTVPENILSDLTCKSIANSVTCHVMDRHHIIVYTIPGKDGSLEPGERLVNFCWYTNQSPQSLDEILKDSIDGHRHRSTVPAGRVRDTVWAARLEHARSEPLPSALLEIITKIQSPFIQVITDYYSTRGAFENGQVLLIGDALTLVRPHAGLSSAKSAFHALAIEDYACGRISLAEWEDRVLRYSSLLWAQGAWWGEFYQGNKYTALLSGVQYWTYKAWYNTVSWWKRREPWDETRLLTRKPE